MTPEARVREHAPFRGQERRGERGRASLEPGRHVVGAEALQELARVRAAEAEAAAGLAEEGWLKSGSECIGRCVCRTIYGHVSAGRVVYWIPANDEGDEALWKVRHDDGDVEWLQEYEVVLGGQLFLVQYTVLSFN